MTGMEESVVDRERAGEGFLAIALSSVSTRASGLRVRTGAPGFATSLLEDIDLASCFLAGDGMAAPSF